MAQSNIAGGGEKLPPRPPGHGTAELGPSDSSDSGSDIAGAPGWAAEVLDDDSGNTSDVDRGLGAGPDLGDADLDADTDAEGTGERMAAGRDSSAREAADIEPDRITDDPGGMTRGEDPEGIGVSGDSGRHR